MLLEMLAQPTGRGKGLVTIMAREWLDTRVNALMIH